jgi:hypothetical protein
LQAISGVDEYAFGTDSDARSAAVAIRQVRHFLPPDRNGVNRALNTWGRGRTRSPVSVSKNKVSVMFRKFIGRRLIVRNNEVRMLRAGNAVKESRLCQQQQAVVAARHKWKNCSTP